MLILLVLLSLLFLIWLLTVLLFNALVCTWLNVVVLLEDAGVVDVDVVVVDICCSFLMLTLSTVIVLLFDALWFFGLLFLCLSVKYIIPQL